MRLERALLAMNRTLSERARDMGGTRLTTSAIPMSQTDWNLPQLSG
jgi:hypothetical protein